MIELGDAEGLLLYGDTERNSDLSYATRFHAPDPFFFFGLIDGPSLSLRTFILLIARCLCRLRALRTSTCLQADQDVAVKVDAVRFFWSKELECLHFELEMTVAVTFVVYDFRGGIFWAIFFTFIYIFVTKRVVEPDVFGFVVDVC